ncbi:L,D-transpeptidase [Rhizobium calliandrae]|uniref:L,D-transpeptidase n=1 Tax=Rhizobium calliandrae TaxID=1312182 RepID=A0ABT7KKZ2_9HYPH|nr:L,D-transpeptidase [Rhizobium calliandrae]MDL2407899.1 L,D-transpeptidase [Rhizobium calliandrae]
MHYTRLALALALAVTAMALVACQDQPRTSQPPKTSAFANEPYPVRLVNRARFDSSFQPTQVPNETGMPPGTVVVDTTNRHLYLVETPATAMRYGIAIGRTGYSWRGRATIGRKSTWPAWYPTDDMKAVAPGMPARIPPGTDNPLGARALYLYQDGRDTLIRIHGTSEPWTIGTEASSGCIRMFNEDVIDLYTRVKVGTAVVVL